MKVVDWVDGQSISVEHKGIVTGRGEFSLQTINDDRSAITWNETLRFPWLLGGRVGELIARPLMLWIWKGNLEAFAAIAEA
jgi:hypothetical protein